MWGKRAKQITACRSRRPDPMRFCVQSRVPVIAALPLPQGGRKRVRWRASGIAGPGDRQLRVGHPASLRRKDRRCRRSAPAWTPRGRPAACRPSLRSLPPTMPKLDPSASSSPEPADGGGPSRHRKDEYVCRPEPARCGACGLATLRSRRPGRGVRRQRRPISSSPSSTTTPQVVEHRAVAGPPDAPAIFGLRDTTSPSSTARPRRMLSVGDHRPVSVQPLVKPRGTGLAAFAGSPRTSSRLARSRRARGTPKKAGHRGSPECGSPGRAHRSAEPPSAFVDKRAPSCFANCDAEEKGRW